ncbi:uncharacterized protein KY384_001479 [Bacidia gigantensis]|uniref:uncharacterized protein n=1 Tax=Bacidia gigantensis TaxID=2732470 RepID=UPI001D039922|nr:uncharacterized protein KY384_001479 [Bacidia gigantensis]KAG8533738.1 hypothetical protein KY384_001479 [Bacidia gigantensis]
MPDGSSKGLEKEASSILKLPQSRLLEARGSRPRGQGHPVRTTTPQRHGRWSYLSRQRTFEAPLLSQIFEPHVLAIPPKVPQAPRLPLAKPTKICAYADVSIARPPSRLRPQILEYDVGVPIGSLDISPDHTHAVLAGREILKVIQVDQDSLRDKQDLLAGSPRKVGKQEPNQDSNFAGHRGLPAIKDVKWSHGFFSKKIATAVANGQIVVYDLEAPGHETARLHQHNRQVHKLGFNPFDGALLLSGSQDATVRLWDLRDCPGGRERSSIDSRAWYPGNSDAVRDVKWSPSNAFEFAICTDGGMIQRWDVRKSNAPLLRIRAHEKTCNAVDWHPNGEYILSAGADKDVKVWNFATSDRRAKPLKALRCPQAVLDARWRPASSPATNHDPASWDSLYLATTFDEKDPRTLFWDFARPFVPERVFNNHDSPPTAIVWVSDSLLWSVGSHGKFIQIDVSSLPTRTKQEDKSCLATFAPNGEMLLAANCTRHHGYSQQDPKHASRKGQMSTSIGTINVPGATNTSALDQLLLNKFEPIPSTLSLPTSNRFHVDFERILSHNRDVAAAAHLPLLAQSFSLIAFFTTPALRKRAEFNRQKRLENLKSTAQPLQQELGPQDFLPSEYELQRSAIEAHKIIEKEIESWLYRFHNPLMPIYLILNVCPWFEPSGHRSLLQHDHKVEIVVNAHRHLTRLRLDIASVAKRQQVHAASVIGEPNNCGSGATLAATAAI